VFAAPRNPVTAGPPSRRPRWRALWRVLALLIAAAVACAAWQGYRNPDLLIDLAAFRLC
jgi:hypothetical protein